MSKVTSKVNPRMVGDFVEWVTDNTFAAVFVNAFGRSVKILCHKDYWDIT